MDLNRLHAVRVQACLAALSLAGFLGACDDETTVEPPPPVPQISAQLAYPKASNGLPNGDVYAMLALSNGEFWVGTEQGVARYPSITANARIAGPNGVINELNGLPNPRVRDIAEMDGKVYVATWGGGFAIYDIAGSTWTQRRPTDDTADDVQVFPLGSTVPVLPNHQPEDDIVVNSGANEDLETVPGGDDQIDDETIKCGSNRIVETNARKGPDGSIADIEPSPTEGVVYLATNNGISIYDPDADAFDSFQSLTRPVSSAVAIRTTPTIERWYAPRVETIEDDPPPPMPPAGITVWQGTTTVFGYTAVNSGLPEPNVTCIFRDAGAGNDVFWVATANQGVSRVSVTTKTWTTYTMVHGLPSNTVYAVTRAAAPGSGTTIWAATQNGVARLMGNGTWQGYNSGGGLAADRVRQVYSDDGLRLWVGYIGGAGATKLDPTSAK